MRAYCEKCGDEYHHDVWDRLRVDPEGTHIYLCDDCYQGSNPLSLVDDEPIEIKTNKPKMQTNSCRTKSVKTMLEELRILLVGELSDFRIGIEAYRKALHLPEDTGLGAILAQVKEDSKVANIPHKAFLEQMGQKYVKEATINALMYQVVSQGIQAYEARIEDDYYRQNGGTGLYLSHLKRDTKDAVCHSGDEVPF